jgi:hypothetical protein
MFSESRKGGREWMPIPADGHEWDGRARTRAAARPVRLKWRRCAFEKTLVPQARRPGWMENEEDGALRPDRQNCEFDATEKLAAGCFGVKK